MEIQKAEAEAVAELVRASSDPKVVLVTDPKTTLQVPVLVLPNGMKAEVVKFETYRDAPLRRSGTATAATVQSFIDLVARSENEDSAVFASCDSQTSLSLTAVIDYNKAGPDGAPHFGLHRVAYSFPISEEWKAWKSKDGVQMDQGELAAFIEARIADLGDPADASENAKAFASLIGCPIASPSRVLELSRGLSLRVDSKVGGQVNLSTGEKQITYTEEHNDAAGQPLKVPGAFLLSIPVFVDDGAYAIPVRLAYKVKGGAVFWTYSLYRADKALDDAFRRAVEKVKSSVKSSIYFGSPE